MIRPCDAPGCPDVAELMVRPLAAALPGTVGAVVYLCQRDAETYVYALAHVWHSSADVSPA